MSLVKSIKRKTKYSKDYIVKEMSIKGKKVILFFNEVLTDSSHIDEFILKQLILLDKKSLNKLENTLPVSNIIKIKCDEILKKEDILPYLIKKYNISSEQERKIQESNLGNIDFSQIFIMQKILQRR